METLERRKSNYRGGRRKHGSLAKRVPIRKLMLRDKCICMHCGGWVVIEEASREHLVEFSKGGGSGWSNIALAHRDCNNFRSNPPKGM